MLDQPILLAVLINVTSQLSVEIYLVRDTFSPGMMFSFIFVVYLFSLGSMSRLAFSDKIYFAAFLLKMPLYAKSISNVKNL